MRVFIDLDGVLADMVGQARKLWPELPADDAWPAGEYSIPTVLGITETEFWNRIADQGPEWWATIEPYPWAFDLVRAAAELGEIVLATSPTRNEGAHAGKFRWIQRHFGMDFRGYTLIACGKQILARPDALLIDDLEPSVAMFANAGGNAILFPRPWNSLHALAADPMDHTLAALKQAARVDPAARLATVDRAASDAKLLEDIARVLRIHGQHFVCDLTGGCERSGEPANLHPASCWAKRLWSRVGGSIPQRDFNPGEKEAGREFNP